jgi:hypothetical protein
MAAAPVMPTEPLSSRMKCSALSYKGFNCRKSREGVYLTDEDLADKGAVELGEAFHDSPVSAWRSRPRRSAGSRAPSTRGVAVPMRS